MFYLTTHSTHFIYGYMASDIWLRTILIVRKETRCRHIGYSYRIYRRRMAEHWAGEEGERYADTCVMKETHGVGKSSWFGEPSGLVKAGPVIFQNTGSGRGNGVTALWYIN